MFYTVNVTYDLFDGFSSDTEHDCYTFTDFSDAINCLHEQQSMTDLSYDVNDGDETYTVFVSNINATFSFSSGT